MQALTSRCIETYAAQARAADTATAEVTSPSTTNSSGSEQPLLRVAVCTIYFPDQVGSYLQMIRVQEAESPSWAAVTLRLLGYDSDPGQLQVRAASNTYK
jgi:hypothetical protein